MLFTLMMIMSLSIRVLVPHQLRNYESTRQARNLGGWIRIDREVHKVVQRMNFRQLDVFEEASRFVDS